MNNLSCHILCCDILSSSTSKQLTFLFNLKIYSITNTLVCFHRSYKNYLIDLY